MDFVVVLDIVILIVEVIGRNLGIMEAHSFNTRQYVYRFRWKVSIELYRVESGYYCTNNFGCLSVGYDRGTEAL